MDTIISGIAALGVPGLILALVMISSGLKGAARLTSALAAIGPGGMLGGLLILAIVGLVGQALSNFGIDVTATAIIKELYRRGETKESILSKIDMWPVSPSLKRKLREDLEAMYAGSSNS